MAGVLVTPSVKGGGYVGIQRRLSIPPPLAGADFSITLPGGSWWRLLCLRASLATSAVVASRAVRFQLLDGAVILDEAPSGSSQAASLTNSYSFGPNRVNLVSAVAPASVGVSIPDVVVPGGYVFRVVTVALDVGDQWSAVEGLAEEMDQGPFGGGWGINPFDAASADTREG